jgi:hypothetical protein
MTIPFAFIMLLGAAPCTPASGNAHSVLQSAVAATGLRAADARVLHLKGFDVVSQDFQSDRMYPPFLSSVGPFETWFSPASGVERTSSRTAVAGNSYLSPTSIASATASYVVRDTAFVPSEQVHASLYTTRPLNVWAMLDDWLASPTVRVVERCEYRDYPRLVLSRLGPRGAERLFVDERTGIPLKLDRIEPHYLWGQVHVEYVYSTWQRLDNVLLPGVSFRVVDDRTNIERTFETTSLVPADSAPSLMIPRSDTPMGYPIVAFLAPSQPDTIRVTPTTFLLKNRGYTETVTLRRDTVYLFDATQGDERSQKDSVWIGKLFPGRHPIVVVVTDLAWPHVSGVRYWVAQGATIVSHRAARGFLESVVERRWTAQPDLLERRRARSRLRFVGVSDSLRLAGGDLLLFAIDGRTSEVALAAYVRPDRFLWASDFIQTLQEPSAYLDDVWQAVTRVGVTPERVAAEHLALSQWGTADRLARRPPAD